MALTATVGVLALQGDFAEHCASVRRLGARAVEVRTRAELDATDALIVPGGESTSMAKLMDAYDLRGPLAGYARSGRPVWGSCAGLILLASRIEEDRPQPLGVVDMTVRRNGFGRQVDSFEVDLPVAGLDGPPMHAVFIRAPRIVETGPDVEPLAALDDGSVVAVRQGNVLATAFHPELTPDTRLHAMLVAMIDGAHEAQGGKAE